MAIKYFCDRCDDEMTQANYNTFINTYPLHYNLGYVWCDDCRVEVEDGLELLNQEFTEEDGKLDTWIDAQKTDLYTNENWSYTPYTN